MAVGPLRRRCDAYSIEVTTAALKTCREPSRRHGRRDRRRFGNRVVPGAGTTSGVRSGSSFRQQNGRKTTRSSPHIRPETVIYDVDLTLDLPLDTTVTSAVNAMAHAVEALYSTESNPITDLMAIEGDLGIARPNYCKAAWLAGTCLGTVGMGLHHKLCHTLGGSFGLPHAPAPTPLSLPTRWHSNAPAVPDVMSRIATALGASDAATGVFDLVTACGGPTTLRELGMSHDQIENAVELSHLRRVSEPA
ncbi:unnamed protein product, partial [Mesorhabditis spiculigera]